MRKPKVSNAELGNSRLIAEYLTYLRVEKGLRPLSCEAYQQYVDELAAQRLRVGDISSPERDLAGLALGEAQIQQASLAGPESLARRELLEGPV